VETCTHYIAFAAEDIPDKRTEYKCAPPIRGRANRDKLWEGLRSGEIDQLASDHSPSPPELKCLETGDFLKAWGGISSVGVRAPKLEQSFFLTPLGSFCSAISAQRIVSVLDSGPPVR
jgi:allantoinase